jgi:hypothetical protein
MEQNKDNVRRRSKRQWFARVFRRLRSCVNVHAQPEGDGQFEERLTSMQTVEEIATDSRSAEAHHCSDSIAVSASSQDTERRRGSDNREISASSQHTEKRRGRDKQPVVKNTFLEFVLGDTGSSPELPLQAQKARAQSDAELEYARYGASETESVMTGECEQSPIASDDEERSPSPEHSDPCKQHLRPSGDVSFEAVDLSSFASTVDGFEDSQSRVEQQDMMEKSSEKKRPMSSIPSSGASSFTSVSGMPRNLAVHSPSWPVGLLPSTGSPPGPLQQSFPSTWSLLGSTGASPWGSGPDAPASAEDQSLRAAELEVQAALLNLSALKAEAAARKVPVQTSAPATAWAEAQAPVSSPEGTSDVVAPSPASQNSLPSKLPKGGRKSVGKSRKADTIVSSTLAAIPSADLTSSVAGLDCSSGDVDTTGNTTVMLRHLPPSCTRDWLVQVLDSQGFGNCYDFVYLPVDFVKWQNFGYAFVNFVSPKEASRSWQHFHGFTTWPRDIMSSSDSDKSETYICEVSWGDPLQGFEAYVERYRDSPVMHREVPEQYKPLIFSKGARVPFPAPTKRIRRPRLKLSSVGESGVCSLIASTGETEVSSANGDAAGGFPSTPKSVLH